MIASPRDSGRGRYRWGLGFGSIYLVVALFSASAYLADRHEYSIPLFILLYASFPVHWVLFGLCKPQMVFVERLPQGEFIGLAILVGLTALFYFGVGQLLALLVNSARRWVAPVEQSER